MSEEANDWIEWAGGECPVNTYAEMGNIQFRKYGRDHHTSEAVRMLLGCSGWKHDPTGVYDYDIIAYRIVQP